MDKDAIRQVHELLADSGKPMQAGWETLRTAWLPHNTPPEQLDMLRGAFFAGGQHLFSVIIQVMEEGVEPTDKDMDRMTAIANKLEAFYQDFILRHFPKGTMQ